ncbi:MAG: 4-(cytidine 5'-diphospho)-2-C-methyl-D-erythritol kinase [Thermoleophilaceae bacterium]|nr:4-(cytidine 5'-diphospho)-2-C-methyl-D-erythritol kinase [Thermoleophilaceae bacterium]
MSFTCAAPAKLNLCLYLGPTREDGLHELVSMFDSFSLLDHLTLKTAASEDPSGDTIDTVVCKAVAGENLVQRALAACRANALLSGPAVEITIDKQIPIAAGLGGGSADAAAALRMVAALYDRDLAEFDRLAFELGADVPSQLRPGATLVHGAGEHVIPVDPRCLTKARRAYVVVAQQQGLSTAEVFQQADRINLPRENIDATSEVLVSTLTNGLTLDGLCELVHNELTPAIVSLRPELELVPQQLRDAGALVAEFTGSGPTCFGIFPSLVAAQTAAEQLRAAGHDARAGEPVGAQAAQPHKLKEDRHKELR